MTTSTVSSPNSYVSQGVVYSNFTFETILDKETIAKLAAPMLVLIRVPDLKSGERDRVDKKYCKAVNDGVKYIIAN